MSETLPSPELTPSTPPVPTEPPPVEQKLRGVLGAMSEAVSALLDTSAVDRFGRAARLCVMGQKISADLVTTIKEAKKVRALDNQQNALMGGMGAEAQYVAQGGGDVNALAEEYADHAILNPAPEYVGHGVGMVHGGDQTQMMRDMMMMVQSAFADQKKAATARLETRTDTDAADARYQLYSELNELLRARDALKAPADLPLLQRVQQQIEEHIDLIAKGNPDDRAPPDTDVVPAELLRGHPPGAGQQWGNSGHPSGPILHREDRGEGPAHGVSAHGDLEVGVG